MAKSQTQTQTQEVNTESQEVNTESVNTESSKAFNVPVSETFRDAVNAHISTLSWECVTKGGIISRPPSLRYFLTATLGPVVNYVLTDDDKTPGRTDVDPEVRATLDAVTKAVKRGLTPDQLAQLKAMGLA